MSECLHETTGDSALDFVCECAGLKLRTMIEVVATSELSASKIWASPGMLPKHTLPSEQADDLGCAFDSSTVSQ